MSNPKGMSKEALYHHAVCSDHPQLTYDSRNCPFCMDRHSYNQFVEYLAKHGRKLPMSSLEMEIASAEAVDIRDLMK